MEKTIMARIMGNEPVSVSNKITLYELSKKYTHLLRNPIILAKVNNELQELHKCLVEDCDVEFLDITDPNGFRVYQRSLVFIMIYAAKLVLGNKTRIIVEHSINKNYYCEIHDIDKNISHEVLHEIEKAMMEVVDKNLPIEKMSISLDESVSLAKEFYLADKVNILKYRRTSNVNFYKLDWFYDYFYGTMAPSTGYFNNFKLILREPGFILQFPSPSDSTKLCELVPLKKISQVFLESSQWARILKVDTVGALNDGITQGNSGDIIRITEALHEKKIAHIADRIHKEKKNIVLIAGPSSSGKTTFAERLCIQLRVNGLRPHIISLDNYFLGRDKAPLDEFGKPNFEALSYMDKQQLNNDLTKLLEGETIQIPEFNFITGEREYKGRFIKLYKDEILVLEGIHGINEELTEQIPRDKKFKIFISALTQLNIDDHNRIPTTDTRLLRRIVRDNRIRGMEATRTISMWPSVLRGETQNIFPFQEEADALFNSALVYEMCVLKQYVEPLLFRIERNCPEYTEARRLIKFLDSFLGVSSEDVPKISILREFIGGSCFNA